MKSEESCPCDSGNPFRLCCGPLLARLSPATSAEALMRSRYTAYVLGNIDYLLSSWDPNTRPDNIQLDASQKWLGLKIRKTVNGSIHDNSGEVEFVARYKIAGRGYRLHENSHFSKTSGQWLYVDGDLKT